MKNGKREYPRGMKSLFWEYDFTDVIKYPSNPVVIERLLEFGDRRMVEWLIENAGKAAIMKFLHSLGKKRLSPKSQNFWTIYFGTKG